MKFFRSHEELTLFCQKIKLELCPHCKQSGFLNLHGFLRGNDENTTQGIVTRGRRFFCSNRGNRKGCGKTFSILKSFYIWNHTITVILLWKIIEFLLNDMPITRATNLFNTSTIFRIIKKLSLRQSFIRQKLLVHPPPEAIRSPKPIHQTMQHLVKTFAEFQNPFEAFQNTFQVSIL